MKELKVGDTVLVKRVVKKEEGWDDVWVESMDTFVGKRGKVVALTSGGVDVLSDHCDWPFIFPRSALEYVDD